MRILITALDWSIVVLIAIYFLMLAYRLRDW